MSDANGGPANEGDLVERGVGDRHHFRFVVSPGHAAELADLRPLPAILHVRLRQASGQGSNGPQSITGIPTTPYIYFLVRCVADTGADLVIARGYVARGMRSRAEDLVSLELGPEPEHEIHAGPERVAAADRWTRLDREIRRRADELGRLDLRPERREPDDPLFSRQMIHRLKYLETMGLAVTDGAGHWVVEPGADGRLRDPGLRGDIVKTMHKALTERGLDRAVEDYVIDPPANHPPIVGRLVAVGLHERTERPLRRKIIRLRPPSHFLKG